MIDIKELQKKVYENKIEKGFNTTDLYLEFCYLSEEVSEAFAAYHRKKDDLGEELADVIIYLLGISYILKIDLEKEVLRKIKKNKRRKYKEVNGVAIKVQDPVVELAGKTKK